MGTNCRSKKLVGWELNINFSDELISYNWMPCVADLTLDYDNDYYKSCGVSRRCEGDDITEESLTNMKPNDIIFIKTDFIRNGLFEHKILPKIKVPFILISGVSSYSIENYDNILNSPLLLKWYCTNPPCRHEKIKPLPIGFEERERDGGDQEILKRYYDKVFVDKTERVLLPYHTIGTNPIRDEHIEYLRTLPFVDFQETKLPFSEYLEQLSKYKYCICLEGAGWDTHRNYECLLTQTVPIMLRSNIKLIYDNNDLPCEFVSDWKNINQNFYNHITSQHYNFSWSKYFLLTQTHVDRILND